MGLKKEFDTGMDGCRTHHGSQRVPTTDFEDREAHRDLTIPTVKYKQQAEEEQKGEKRVWIWFEPFTGKGFMYCVT